jgi:hypothetical protein
LFTGGFVETVMDGSFHESCESVDPTLHVQAGAQHRRNPHATQPSPTFRHEYVVTLDWIRRGDNLCSGRPAGCAALRQDEYCRVHARYE